MRVALYGRVSTNNKGQDPENQLTQLRQWCADAGHTCVGEYIDYETGKKSDREKFNLLFADAHRRQFDVVVFWLWIGSHEKEWCQLSSTYRSWQITA